MKSFPDFSSMYLAFLRTAYLRAGSICTINEFNLVLKNHSFRLLTNRSNEHIFDNGNKDEKC